jgi:tetratricopeptide (TPR) repeat protein
MIRWPLLLLLTLGLVAWDGAAPAADGLSRLDEALVADAADGSLTQFDFLSACLIAGGWERELELAERRERLDTACEGVIDASLLQLPPEDRPRAVLERMHARLLTGRYEKAASDLPRVLETGDFNCLSALVLYEELCRRAGVPLVFVARAGHVSARIVTSPISVEPTSPRRTVAIQQQTDGESQSISREQLLGRFYYNRGLALLAVGNYREGVALSLAACRLDPDDEDARANVLAGLQNWSATMSMQNTGWAGKAPAEPATIRRNWLGGSLALPVAPSSQSHRPPRSSSIHDFRPLEPQHVVAIGTGELHGEPTALTDGGR